ncbi:MAG: hypothetical protein IKG18_12860 [Atopobiaceae bacterium]|nr:hypothetical protein [Atopobiaceae bacterium]MBR3315017.1 hypothetical protein [Atopobiaceae bacterium]
MLDNKQGNVVVLVVAIVVALAVIVAVGLLIFGDYLIPIMQGAAPYSYLTVLVVFLAILFFAAS